MSSNGSSQRIDMTINPRKSNALLPHQSASLPSLAVARCRPNHFDVLAGHTMCYESQSFESGDSRQQRGDRVSHFTSYSIIIISLIRVCFMLAHLLRADAATSADTMSADFAMPWIRRSHWLCRIFILFGARRG
ncbi:hypothetical protein IQ06DRAFT_31221 [Phaeosphaeriaceae sp. SRC1lsM3a]|nr:hypothetical protein IQ06DRAFT_31221 [Stagonospora sp. SRC1lsM3a]